MSLARFNTRRSVPRGQRGQVERQRLADCGVLDVPTGDVALGLEDLGLYSMAVRVVSIFDLVGVAADDDRQTRRRQHLRHLEDVLEHRDAYGAVSILCGARSPL